MIIIMKIDALNVMEREAITTRDARMRGRKEIIDIRQVQGVECQVKLTHFFV